MEASANASTSLAGPARTGRGQHAGRGRAVGDVRERRQVDGHLPWAWSCRLHGTPVGSSGTDKPLADRKIPRVCSHFSVNL